MEIKKGIPVSSGVAIGKAFVLDTERFRIHSKFLSKEEVAGELDRYGRAVEKVASEIERLVSKIDQSISPDVTRIIETHLSILRDPHLDREIRGRIKNDLYAAERAVSVTMRRYIKAFKGMKDEFFSHR